MPNFAQSDRIRELVRKQYVLPAIDAGKTRLSIRAGDVLKEAAKNLDFPRSRTPTICEVLEGKQLMDENGLEIERIEGLTSKPSRKVVVHYRVSGNGRASQRDSDHSERKALSQADIPEDSAAWAKRVTSKMAGLLKEEMSAYGGGDAFMKWIRSDGDVEE